GGEGNDILVGGVAKDLLTGGNGADLLIGGAGNDVLYGDAMQIGPAYLDWSVGRQVIPGDGITTYRVVTTQAWLYEDSAQVSDDTLHGGAGDDWLFGGAGNDLLDGGENADVLLGEAGNDTLIGGMGNDELNGDNAYLPEALHGDDWLDGGEGDDKLFGGAGDDVLIGGKGNDILVGGKGKDTYIFNAGDGKDDIYDTDTGPEASVIVFGEGVNRNNIKLHKGSMIVDFGDGDSLHFTAFDDMDPLGTPLVSAFQFSDGYSMSWDELLSRGFDIDGTNGDDVLIGTGVEDRIDGKDGDDSIQGLGGDDTITGGPGTDAMDGGAGNDTYVLNLGDSPANQGGAFEAIYDESGDDAIRLGDGIVISNLITETTNEEDLLIRYGGGQVVIVGGQRGVIENIQFADGSKFSIHSFVGQTLHAAQDVSIFERGVMLMGGTEADILTSYGGDNTISGGHGDDHLFGFDGGNTYLYELGDGVDTITDNSAKIDHFGNTLKNTLRFGKGIVPDDITLGYRGDQLILTIAGSEAICIKGFDAADALGKHAIDIFAFSDGTTLTYPELLVRGFEIHDADESSLINGTSLEDRIHGNSGDDALHGLSGNDHLWGGGEDDILYGGAGDDVYYFNLGDGSDTVIDTEGTNRVVFGAGLNFVDVRIEQAMGVDGESYLDLTFASGDRFSIRMGERGYVQAFDFDGEVYGVNDLLAMLPSLKLIGDGTDEVLAGFEGDDTLWGGGGADTLNGNAGNDMLDGGARDDVLNGGIGVDTYIFNVGGGHDVVNEVAGEVSILGLGVGISPELLNYSRVGYDLVLKLRADGGTIRISGYFNNPDDWTVRLNDDSIIQMATLLQLTQVQPNSLEAILSQYRSEARASLIAQWIREGYQVDANGVAHYRSSYANDYSAYGGNLQYVNREETYSAEFIAVDIQNPLNLPTSLNNFLYSSRAYSRGRASQHVASNYSSHNEFSTEWINQYVPARRAPADWHFISWNSSLSKSGGIQIPSTTYYFQRDPAGNIVGIWYWGSSGEIPASVGLALVTVERVTETQSHHSYLPEFTLTDGDDVLSLFQSGIVYGGVGDDFIELGSDEYMEGIRLYYGMGGLAYGGEGDDTIVALDGDNVLIGGRGQDTLIGGHESDT
ncbi:MAG: hypothetical protein K2X00_22185, partial [Nitrospiraceae bacterium]|nr:hypothetical protein [Nitrospiraceae bacterium]